MLGEDDIVEAMKLFGDLKQPDSECGIGGKNNHCDRQDNNYCVMRNTEKRKFSQSDRKETISDYYKKHTEKSRMEAENYKKIAILEKLKDFSTEEKTENVIQILGNDYSVDCNKESYRNKLKQIYSILNNTGYDWFKEERGYGNWVLFRTDQFEISEIDCNSLIFIRPSSKAGMENRKIKFLKYKHKHVGSVELPFNISSCFMMFRNSVFDKDTKFQIERTTKHVIDMVGTFMLAEFNDKFVLPKCWCTDKVITMDGMFYRAILRKGFSLGEDFNTKNVLSMSYLFMGTIIQEDFKFPKYFSTVNLLDTRGMFKETSFFCKELVCENKNNEDFFDLRNVLDTSEMFAYAKSFGNTLRFPKNFQIDNVIYAKGMYYGNELNFNFYQKYLNSDEITQKIITSPAQIT